MKFSQVSKLIARFRYVNINYGKIFGKFLDGISETYDKDVSITLTNQEGESEEAKENIAMHAELKTFLEEFTNGNKAKLSENVVSPFLVGKFTKHWARELVKKREMALKKSENVRILAETDKTTEQETDSISTKNLYQEVKYWIYLASWLIKIILMLKVLSYKKQTYLKGLKFVKILSIHQSIHFLLFNLTVVNVMFVGSRGIVHLRHYPEIKF